MIRDFTPFGYLRNVSHVARAWGDTEGGNLRTAPEWVGVEWVYPVGRDANSGAGLALETEVGGRACQTRADFDCIGLTCRYHTCLIFGCEWQVDDVHVDIRFFLVDDHVMCARLTAANRSTAPRHVRVAVTPRTFGEPPLAHVMTGATSLDTDLAPAETRHAVAVLARGDDAEGARRRGLDALERAETAYSVLLREDQRFAQSCPTLVGDWPAHWREGLHHDFQTTRLLVQPSGGIFTDVWPAWMAAWPRVVLAEGTLDMLRLAYAEPSVALRAVLSLFRDAPEPNVPCVFRGGEYNMVAADGSRCGTSPAWCLPFLNLELLYLRTLDQGWLAQLYPLAAAYLEWWLLHRVDREGWIVYKCTWESGEDGNPRLDPSGSGDADISGRLRPVELQASVAHAAGVLAFFASELGLDAERWRAVERDYTARTRKLFDSTDARYKDWLIVEGRLQEACPDRPYWGVDSCRYSAQSLTPLLVGLPLGADEIRRHITPPWTLWPSWTWSIVESAAAAGHFATLGQLSFETIDRVYRATTRRQLGSFARPLPGSSPEFWPVDWRTYGGSDAYGWGATTANLLIRHLFGFKESRDTDGWVAELTPALPPHLLHVGAHYGLRQLSYRGVAFDLTYTVRADGLEVALDLHADPQGCRVERDGEALYDTGDERATRHTFATRPGERYTLRLR